MLYLFGSWSWEALTSFDDGGVHGHLLVSMNDVSRYEVGWGAQDGDWYGCVGPRVEGSGGQQQVRGLMVVAEKTKWNLKILMLNCLCRPNIGCPQHNQLITARGWLRCDYLCVVLLVEVIAMKPRSLQSWTLVIMKFTCGDAAHHWKLLTAADFIPLHGYAQHHLYRFTWALGGALFSTWNWVCLHLGHLGNTLLGDLQVSS